MEEESGGVVDESEREEQFGRWVEEGVVGFGGFARICICEDFGGEDVGVSSGE